MWTLRLHKIMTQENKVGKLLSSIIDINAMDMNLGMVGTERPGEL